MLLLRIFETKIKQDDDFKPLRKLFSTDYKWKNPKTGKEESNENRLFSYLPTVSNNQILSELNDNFFPFYSSIMNSARQVFEGNLPQKVQDQLVLIEEVFSNSNFTNNVNSGNLGEVISIVANDIEEARLLKTDLLGDAIESALSETGGTKDVGLFRTPDHIRQFMTGLIEPTFDDQIFDPACGTGGFLFDAFEFVMRRVDPSREWPGEKGHSELLDYFDDYFKTNKIEFPSIEQTTQFYRGGVTGIEYLGMIRKMAAINFYVRGLNPHNIEQGDSLAKYSPVTDHESKSVILANPPFGAERDQEAYPDVWQEYSKESETTILFVKLMFEQLKQGGKCAVVVSEGFNTWDQGSAKALRKMLLDEAQLKAVISLPQGLFVSKNGQGPKTSILIFEKGGKTDWTWFYKVSNDGYSMGTNRKEQKGNQLVECLSLYHEYVKKGIKPPETKNQFCIPAQWIKTLDPRIKNKIRKETRAVLAEKGKKERVKKEKELNKKVKAKKISEEEKLKELKTFDQMLENRIQNEIAKRIDKAHNYSFNLANYKSTLSESQINDWRKALKHIQPNGATTLDEVYKKLNYSKPQNVLPYLLKLNPANALEADIAREYVSNLDKSIVAEQKELYAVKEIIKSGAKYPMVKLKDYLILNTNKIKPSKTPDVNYKVLGVSNDVGIFLNEKLDATETNQSYFVVAKNEFCYNPYRINVGSIGLNTFDYDNQIISGAYLVFACKEEELNPKYLDALFNSKGFLSYVDGKANGGVRMNFKFEDMEAWEIPLPSIEEQNEIVAQIEKQKAIIEGADKVISNWSIDFEYYFSRYKFSQKALSELIIESLYGSSEKSDYQDEGYNILRIGNVGFCDFKLDDIKKSSLSEKDFNKYKLQKGDFLIVRSNGNPKLVGKCAVWNSEEQFAYASYLIRFRFKLDEVEPKYVMYFFMSPNGRELLNPQAGGGTYNISATEFQKVQIPYPKIDIQRQIIIDLDAKMEILRGLHKMKTEAEQKIEKILAEVWGVDKKEPTKTA
ncbi:putative type I restriction enzymeP M protein [Saccharicrinis fermentans DSM 9555 = JCM 21142]|uniref:site-specific DNA-methyltransferase (adenine-specific) n=1 Tax=Saccharicrinis fermentans DSM 9555 = JCM 21142 TaxID=869213 RepID=W7YBB9_9BACT|nr:putative type I restriction enzymeP M protein [Saccharicrinis fermentans DSM 9555 = JCM 21142]